MKKTQELLKEITDITYKIETEYPELYRFLDENPITVPVVEHPSISNKVLSDYLVDLKNLLNNHIQSHKIK